jgi:hypothetical protein
MDMLGSGDTSVMLHIAEIHQWADEVEQWAAATGASIPERGSNLDYVLDWEASAHAYTRRLTDTLRTYGKEHAGGAPRALPRKGHAFISYVREDGGVVQQLYDELKGYGAVIWMDRSALVPGREMEASHSKGNQGRCLLHCLLFGSVRC